MTASVRPSTVTRGGARDATPLEEAAALGVLLRDAARHCDRLTFNRTSGEWVAVMVCLAPRKVEAYTAPTLAEALAGVFRQWIGERSAVQPIANGDRS